MICGSPRAIGKSRVSQCPLFPAPGCHLYLQDAACPAGIQWLRSVVSITCHLAGLGLGLAGLHSDPWLILPPLPSCWC